MLRSFCKSHLRKLDDVGGSACIQVTAVGHAAILAAIQKYVPALVSFSFSS